MNPASRAALLMVVGAVAFSPTATAHGGADWMHGTLDGAVLFFTSLQSLLPVLVVALLARRNGFDRVAIRTVVLGIALIIGLLALPVAGDPVTVGLYARSYLIALALLVLFNLRAHAGLVLVLGLVTGALTGLEFKAVLIGDPATGFSPAVGFIASAICFHLPVALIASRHPHGWQRIAIRVVAGWIAAIAAMDIAFTIGRPG